MRIHKQEARRPVLLRRHSKPRGKLRVGPRDTAQRPHTLGSRVRAGKQQPAIGFIKRVAGGFLRLTKDTQPESRSVLSPKQCKHKQSHVEAHTIKTLFKKRKENLKKIKIKSFNILLHLLPLFINGQLHQLLRAGPGHRALHSMYPAPVFCPQ